MRDGSVVLPGSDAAVIRIKADSLPVMSAELAAKVGDAKVSEKFIAMTVDCNGGYVYLDPYEGAKAAVAEACRNLACSGAVPLGATDNLNMANPHKPELFWQMQGIRARPGRSLPSLQRARHRRQLLALQSKPRRPD